MTEPDSAKPDMPERPICGVVRPISATARRSAKHWEEVGDLLHRAALRAGFSPRNVWEHTASDRISETIVGNIFSDPIVIADLSDLNANALIEFGLRLASKKPMVAVIDDETKIPFDAGDFRFLLYPSNLNWHAIEKFVQEAADLLRSKHDAAGIPGYSPFLSKLIVNVVAPTVKEVSAEQRVLQKVEEIADQVRRISAKQTLGATTEFTTISDWSFVYKDCLIPSRMTEYITSLANKSRIESKIGDPITDESSGDRFDKVTFRIETRVPNWESVMSHFMFQVSANGGRETNFERGFHRWA